MGKEITLPQNLQETPWCLVKNNGEEAEIEITGVIGWGWGEYEEDQNNTTQRLQKELQNIANLKVKTIIVNIDSPGGSVAHGLHMYDVLASHKANVITRAMGMTASAATIIHQAGNTREISANSLYLIHQAWDMFMANAAELETKLEEMQNINKTIRDIYLKNGGEVDAVDELFNADNGNGKWITAQEALEAGLADVVYEPKEIKAAALPRDEVKAKLKLPDLPTNLNIMSEEKTTNKLLEAINGLRDEIRGWFDKKDGEDAPTAEALKTLEDSVADMESRVIDSEKQVETISAEKAELEKTLSEKQARIDELEKEVTEVNAKMTKVETAEGREDATDGNAKISKEDAELLKAVEAIDSYYGSTHEDADADADEDED